MESQPDQHNDSPKSGLNLKRILICSAIFGVVVVGISQYSSLRRNILRKDCLNRLSKVNQALVLYRADSDGFSPAYDRQEVLKPDAKLTKYSGGATMFCPSQFYFHPGSLRVARGGRVNSIARTGLRPLPIYVPFGIEDNSVVLVCENHFDYRSTYDLSKLPSLNLRHDYMSGGTYTVLLRSGEARLIPFNAKVETWISRNGVFLPSNQRPSSWGGYSNNSLFNFEPKPPQYEY